MKNLTAKEAISLRIGQPLIFIGTNKNYLQNIYRLTHYFDLIGKKCKLIRKFNDQIIQYPDDALITVQFFNKTKYMDKYMDKYIDLYYWRFGIAYLDNNLICKNKK